MISLLCMTRLCCNSSGSVVLVVGLWWKRKDELPGGDGYHDHISWIVYMSARLTDSPGFPVMPTIAGMR